MKAAALDQPSLDADARLRRILETQRDVVAADLDLQAVMNLICERTQELTGAESGSILMLDGDDLVHRAATGFMSGYVGERVALDGTSPAASTGTTARRSAPIQKPWGPVWPTSAGSAR